MIPFIKKIIKIYFAHFPFYLKVISPLLIPLIALRLTAHYAYFGRLTVIFSTVFGVTLIAVGAFVTIVLIYGSFEHVASTTHSSIAQHLRGARKNFPRYLMLKLLTLVISASMPFILVIFAEFFANSMVSLTMNILAISWTVFFVFMFLFSSYSLLVENQGVLQALKRGMQLILYKPFTVALKFMVAGIFSGSALTVLAALTTSIIAVITGQTDLVFDSTLARMYSPWWQQLVIDVYVLLGLPLLIIITSFLFAEVKGYENEDTRAAAPFSLKPL